MNSVPDPAAPPNPGQRLDHHFVSGLAWTALAKWGGQVISWLSLFVLAKLLTPHDFGLLGMTGVFTGIVTTLSECGIDGAIVVATDLTPVKIRQMHTVSVILGFCALVIMVLAAPLMVWFFRAPELIWIVPVMGLAFIITSFRVVPYSLLTRDMRFKAISAIEGGQSAIQSLTAVLLAWWDFHYWALVISVLVGFLFSSSLLFKLYPCGLARLDLAQVKDELRFSGRLLVARLSWFVYSNADFAVAGRVLGAAPLGVYSMAWNIASVPVEKVASLLSRVAPSVLMQAQGEPAEMSRYIRGMTETLALISFPVAFGTAIVAQPLVETVFDSRWWPVAPILQLLAVCAAARCLATVCQPVLSVIGEIGFTMKISLLMAVVLPLSFLFGSRWGGVGIAAAWLVTFPVLNLPLVARMLTRTAIPIGQYVAALRPAGIASIAMIGGVWLVQLFFKTSVPWIRLSLDVCTGGFFYLGTLFLFFRPRLIAVMTALLRHKGPLPA